MSILSLSPFSSGIGLQFFYSFHSHVLRRIDNCPNIIANPLVQLSIYILWNFRGTMTMKPTRRQKTAVVLVSEEQLASGTKSMF
jgi:hypothetical protein